MMALRRCLMQILTLLQDNSTALSIAMEAGHREIGVLLYAHLNFKQGSPVSARHVRASRYVTFLFQYCCTQLLCFCSYCPWCTIKVICSSQAGLGLGFAQIHVCNVELPRYGCVQAYTEQSQANLHIPCALNSTSDSLTNYNILHQIMRTSSFSLRLS